MEKIFIHLSDLHFRKNWEEDQDVVLNTFFQDLQKQLIGLEVGQIYFVFSGDLVLAGGQKELYESFFEQFNEQLNKLNIPKSRRICIPGNHDISVEYIKDNYIEHEGVVALNLSEKNFNDYISKTPKLLIDKLSNYKEFETKFADYGISSNDFLSGQGYVLDDIGVYCLNTTLCSSGGFNKIDDRGRLSIDTRNLQKWLIDCKTTTKVLVMHHPLDWLTEWSREELSLIIKNNFSLCLSGHVHEQSFYHSINKDTHFVNCSAPPLLTNKKDNLGYSIISITSEGVSRIKYRQWTKNKSFVTGVNFSNTDDGIVVIKSINKNSKQEKEPTDFISKYLINRFNESLKTFSSQPIVWVDPIISKLNEPKRDEDGDSDNLINIQEFIAAPVSTIIEAPPQFGLTCLSHFIVKESWIHHKSFWLYLDSKEFESHSLNKVINFELEKFELQISDIKCIVLDSLSENEKDSSKLIKKITDTYDIPLIIMRTVDDSMFLKEKKGEALKEKINRKFDVLYLLPLPRTHVRKVVSSYNEAKHIGEEDAVITKVVSDLEVLNLHRTPLNCLTLLKVSEKYFDESPVNRTEMIKLVLLLLFNMDEIPSYKTKPDLKDCEYILGRFCEGMIRTNNYIFSRDYFLTELKKFCKDRVIDLEVEVVFDVLHINNIIIKRENKFCFRFAYWIYYFAAQRMQQDSKFADYIFEDKRYFSFPEIIEFYTGIDRSREDALKLMINDLRSICSTVYEKVGLRQVSDPFRFISWQPSDENIRKMKTEISENVLSSNLPESVKDKYADRSYNSNRPYDQSIQSIFHEYSIAMLLQSVKASSKALRNSDYVNPDVKRELLQEITRSWEQLTYVLLALTPVLAEKGNAGLDGTLFILIGNFGDTLEQRVNKILQNIPFNVVNWFKDDISSAKIGPLIYDQLNSEENELKRHELVLLLIYAQPRDWFNQVQNYISSISKNSFYLFDIYLQLRIQYRFGFVSPKALHDLEYLIKMCVAKHELGTKKPGIDAIKKISDNAIPKREVDSEALK